MDFKSKKADRYDKKEHRYGPSLTELIRSLGRGSRRTYRNVPLVHSSTSSEECHNAILRMCAFQVTSSLGVAEILG